MKTEFERSGAILDVDLLAGLVALWRAGSSGSLRFSRGAIAAGFDLAGGDVVGVSSSEPRFETAAILVRAGKLEAAALERLSVPPGGDAALAALQAGILTRREWRWGEKIRAIEILADLLAWSDGTYALDSDARPPAGEFTLSIPRLILELFLRSRDRHLVEHQLGATDVPLVRSADFDDLFPTFGLTADAESVVRLIDGQASAAEIQEKAPADEFAVSKLLAALATLGLVGSGAPEPERTRTAETSFPAVPAALEPAYEEPGPPEISPWPSAAVEPEEDVRSPEADEPPAEEPPPHIAPPPAAITEAADPGREAGNPLDAPLGEPEEAADARDALISSWNEPAARSPELFSPEPGIPPSLEAPERPRRAGPGLLLTGLIALLGAGVLAIVLLRSRSVSVGNAAATGSTAAPQAVPTAAPPAATAAPAITIPPAETASAPGSASRRQRSEPAVRRPTPPPAASGSRPTAAPERAAASAKPALSAPRDEWLRRARRDQRRLASERGTRYAVQLELACEVPSLVDAWKHDKPAGTMWLLPVSHGGRECFRVLWGRYPTLQTARAGKGRIPAFFTTASNHPAVVAVR